MNVSRYFIASIAVFIFIFLFEWLFHGVFMENLYQATTNLWRPKEDMKVYFPFLILGQLILAFTFCFIFTKGFQNRGLFEGLRYGFYVAILMSAPMFMWYTVQPLPAEMVIYWIIAGFIELILAGALVSMIYRSK